MPGVSVSKQDVSFPEKPASEKDFNEAVQIVNFFLLAWKNCSLYPEGHIAAIKALQNLKASFESFFSHHNSLRLTAEKNKLLWGNTILLEGSSDNQSEDFISLLYRDGIQWLEFYHGLSLDELVYFFSVMKKYRMLAEEAEGDIVTGLNDGNLEHIDFKAVDIFWEDLPLLDFSTLNAELPETQEPVQHKEIEETEDSKGSDQRETQVKSIADPSRSKMLWKISSSEKDELQKMIQEEENWDNSEDVLDVLLIILRSQTERNNFSSVLDFAKEEIVETIVQGELNLLLNFFQSIYQLLYRDPSEEFEWRRPEIDQFFQDLSNPEIFDLITGKLITLHEGNTKEIQVLREIFLYFPPPVILLMGPVILQTKVSAVQKMILEIIEYLSLKDMEPVAMLLDHPDQKLGEKLLPVLGRLRGEQSYNVFLKMSEHPSELVRREAVRVLLSRDSQTVLKLSHLLNDPSFEIRKLILAGIAKHRSAVLENLLLKHIKENKDNEKTVYILACYEALGRCGSNRMIPHLRKVLFDHGWNRFVGFGKPVHREGAAIALALLHTEQAESILLKASKSRFKVIREAFDKAMSMRATSGEETNG
ncbi:HEAT repeat domain-containing protein [Thermodesulfobacteriota bacterium]